VRIRVKGLAENRWSALDRFGRWRRDDEWVVIEGIAPERVPEMVEELIALGGRIEAVVPEQQSLESRFLELLGKS
jgi:hypothetical protein